MSELNTMETEKKNLRVVARLIWTVVIFVVSWAVYAIWSPQAMLISAQSAGRQFEESDKAYLQMSYLFRFLGGIDLLLGFVVVVLLIAIWWKPVRRLITGALSVMLIIGAAQFAGTANVWAYADKDNRTEVQSVEADETAFLIPNFGKTGETQSQYMVESFLNRPDVKVPGKLIEIPHTKLTGSGGSSGLSSLLAFDFYVSSVTLAKVKRSLYSREWVQKGRGSNADHDESFPCQTKGGHNVMKIGVSLGVKILDSDAAKYLANFGYEALPGKPDPNDVKAIIGHTFASVRYARSLVDVTDKVLRMEVQTLVCRHIAEYDDPSTASAAMNLMMEGEQKMPEKKGIAAEARAFMKEMGITLTFMGWADSWTFDEEVQFAINQKFVVSQIGDKLEALRRNADINALEGLGVGLRKGNFMLIPSNILDMIKTSNIAPGK